jgi:hypothetical protein
MPSKNILQEKKIEENIDLRGRRRRRRRKQVLADFKKKRGYWKLKEAALDRILWRTGFGRDYGPVVRRTMNE